MSKDNGEPAATANAAAETVGGNGAGPATNGSGEVENPLHKFSDEQLEELAREFDAIHDEVFADLGERDARYIRSIIELHRRLALGSRIVLFGGRWWPSWALGMAMLSAAKILENMEIGHNVMHGQWDWMNDPDIHSSTWDWDTASSAEAWKHSHNYVHHTFTNILGKDKDLGYEIMRIDPHQSWHPVYLLQPIYNLILMAFFEWGVAVHDLDFEAIRAGEKSKSQLKRELKDIGIKARSQIVKDYMAWPALSAGVAGLATWAVTRDRDRGLETARKTFKRTAGANATANVVRNFWSNAIIFCGHFPDQTYTFTQEEVEDESRGGWYVRQLIGAANIEGSDFFHVASGNLGYQVEHHLYPDMPSSRYSEIAPRVKEVCARYGLPYNTGPFRKQWTGVQRTILRLAFPGGKPRPKPGPYRPEGEDAPAGNGAAVGG
jgi:NADPH-dependent stearoyl-CoA 9-desaturase